MPKERRLNTNEFRARIKIHKRLCFHITTIHSKGFSIHKINTHTQEQSLPIFSGPMHVRRECALSDVLNPKKLRRLAEGKSAFKTGRTVLTINLMTAISQTTIEKGQISPIAQWQHIKDLEIHPSHHSLKNTSHSH